MDEMDELKDIIDQFKSKVQGLILGIATVILVQFALVVWLFIKLL